jgi:hypothetical protein
LTYPTTGTPSCVDDLRRIDALLCHLTAHLEYLHWAELNTDSAPFAEILHDNDSWCFDCGGHRFRSIPSKRLILITMPKTWGMDIADDSTAPNTSGLEVQGEVRDGRRSDSVTVRLVCGVGAATTSHQTLVYLYYSAHSSLGELCHECLVGFSVTRRSTWNIGANGH